MANEDDFRLVDKDIHLEVPTGTSKWDKFFLWFKHDVLGMAENASPGIAAIEEKIIFVTKEQYEDYSNPLKGEKALEAYVSDWHCAYDGDIKFVQVD